MEIQKIIDYALSLNNTYLDYPFSDKKYGESPVLKHTKTNKWFGIFMKVNDNIYLNVKTTPEYSELLRKKYSYIIPAYHMNKEYWNTIIINDKNVDENLVLELVLESYKLTS